MLGREASDEKETARTEAFSDGIFTIAITLLVLNLRDPILSGGSSLAQGLIDQWASFFALITSFVTILIMWMNHHNMFNYIHRVDRRVMLMNGLLMLFVVLTPFTTSLVASHISTGDSEVAAGVYSGTFLLLAFVWNGLWRYSTAGHRLLGKDVTDEQVETIKRQYLVAPVFYGAAFVISFFSGLASVVVILAVAGFFAVTATLGK